MTTDPAFIDERTGLDVRLTDLPHLTLTAEDGTVSRYVPVQAHLDLLDEHGEALAKAKVGYTVEEIAAAVQREAEWAHP